MKFAGIDIGGANIKLATVDGISTQLAFPIWKEKCRLPDVLCQIAKTLPPDTLVGITMTAELADCFTTRQTGVEFIVQAASKAFSA